MQKTVLINPMALEILLIHESCLWAKSIFNHTKLKKYKPSFAFLESIFACQKSS